MASESDFEHVQSVVRERLAQNRRLRRNLPGGGRLRIDRQLPFLCIYRCPVERPDPGTRELVTTEAAYLFASAEPQYEAGINGICSVIGETLKEHFGVVLFLELWAAEPAEALEDQRRPAAVGARLPEPALQPAFEIVASEAESLPSMIDTFQAALRNVRIQGHAAQVTVSAPRSVAPAGLPPLLGACPGGAAHCVFVGLAVRPIYRDPRTGELFPVILQSLRRQLAPALRRAIFAFTGIQARHPDLHFDSLGPSALAQAARLVDQQLCEVSESFDFLLQATPINSEQAWQSFADSGYRQTPRLEYRPLPYHPSLLKRRLFEIPIERIEDPTVAHLFWQKQQELDRQIAALRDLGTPRFLYSCLQLYGEPDEQLVHTANRVLEAEPAEAEAGDDSPYIGAESFAKRARKEIDYYHTRQASFNARVDVCSDIASGLMVVRDQLLVSESFGTPSRRVEALLHHEVGTHLLTYFNGREQPFRQLYAGLAGYDRLQEGLAVLAEYLVGGLTRNRLRMLAARVLAVRAMLDRATFTETFDLLHQEHRISSRTAFTTTLRVYRGGGMTKDAIYLRGFCELLEYLSRGHKLEPLYVGKIALEHVPFVQELRRRGVILPPASLPRFRQSQEARQRLQSCRNRNLLDLLETTR